MRSIKFYYALVTVISITFSSSLFAGGPFGLFEGCNKACDLGCASSCASGCDSGYDSGGCLGGGGCGSYVSLFGGFNQLDDLSEAPLRIEFNDGLALGGSIGRQLSHGFRGELEASIRTNTGDIATDGMATIDASGHFITYAGMANLYYDIRQLSTLGVTPYVGAGLGLAIVDGELNVGAVNSKLNTEDFAYQFIVGGSKQIRSGVAAFSEYRNFNVESNPDLEMDTFIFGLRFDR